MNELLVEFCRSGALGPLVLGMSPADVVDRIGKPGGIRDGQGDDCLRRYRYPPVELTMRCFARDAEIRRGPGRDLALAAIRAGFGGAGPLTLPAAIAPPAPHRRTVAPWRTRIASSASAASR